MGHPPYAGALYWLCVTLRGWLSGVAEASVHRYGWIGHGVHPDVLWLPGHLHQRHLEHLPARKEKGGPEEEETPAERTSVYRREVSFCTWNNSLKKCHQ